MAMRNTSRFTTPACPDGVDKGIGREFLKIGVMWTLCQLKVLQISCASPVTFSHFGYLRWPKAILACSERHLEALKSLWVSVDPWPGPVLYFIKFKPATEFIKLAY